MECRICNATLDRDRGGRLAGLTPSDGAESQKNPLEWKCFETPRHPDSELWLGAAPLTASLRVKMTQAKACFTENSDFPEVLNALIIV